MPIGTIKALGMRADQSILQASITGVQGDGIGHRSARPQCQTADVFTPPIPPTG